MLGAPLGTGPAHVVQFWPVAVEGVRESVEQPRSAAMEESVGALATYHAAVERWPNAKITLRNRARIIERSWRD